MKKLSELSPCRKRIVELMRDLQYGQIECLHIRAGNPVFNPVPRIVEDRVFGKEKISHQAGEKKDFVLKKQIVELFEGFDEIRDGLIMLLTIKDGLPFSMNFEKPFRA